MGIAQSISLEDGDGEDEEEREETEEAGVLIQDTRNTVHEDVEKQHSIVPGNEELVELDVSYELQQDPEMVSFGCSASPVSSVNTPHHGPSIRVWDPGHMLNPLSIHHHGRSFNSRLHIPPGAIVGDEICTEIYLIRHAESNMNTLPGMIGGRSPSAVVTPEGRRQARALGVFLLSHGLHFDAVFSSPLERCKQTAVAVCQEVNFSQEKIEFSDALVELSQGVWEGLRRSEIYTPELLNVISNSQLDFHAPGGESQRQVEFRMTEFLNNAVLPRAVEASLQKDTKSPNSMKFQSRTNPLMQVHPLNDEARTPDVLVPLVNSVHVKGIGKSRLRMESSDNNGTVDMIQSAEVEQKTVTRTSPFYVAVFSHAMAIKCLMRGLLGSDPHMTHRLVIDNTSMTVLRHSTHSGWQVLRVNDTAHLRLL